MNRVTESHEPIEGRNEDPRVQREPSAGVASSEARRGASWVWLGLLAAVALVVGTAIVAAASSSDDRGIRGPGDQASPTAPHDEKTPPSTGR